MCRWLSWMPAWYLTAVAGEDGSDPWGKNKKDVQRRFVVGLCGFFFFFFGAWEWGSILSGFVGG